MYEREQRLQTIENKKKEMKEREEKLFFFDRFEEFEVAKADKELAWRKKLPSRPYRRITIKPKAVVSDDYIPPEIGGGRKSA